MVRVCVWEVELDFVDELDVRRDLMREMSDLMRLRGVWGRREESKDVREGDGEVESHLASLGKACSRSFRRRGEGREVRVEKEVTESVYGGMYVSFIELGKRTDK